MINSLFQESSLTDYHYQDSKLKNKKQYSKTT